MDRKAGTGLLGALPGEGVIGPKAGASCSAAGLYTNPLSAGEGAKLAFPSARKCSEDGGAAPCWHLNDARQSNAAAVAAQPRVRALNLRAVYCCPETDGRGPPLCAWT